MPPPRCAETDDMHAMDPALREQSKSEAAPVVFRASACRPRHDRGLEWFLAGSGVSGVFLNFTLLELSPESQVPELGPSGTRKPRAGSLPTGMNHPRLL